MLSPEFSTPYFSKSGRYKAQNRDGGEYFDFFHQITFKKSGSVPIFSIRVSSSRLLGIAFLVLKNKQPIVNHFLFFSENYLIV